MPTRTEKEWINNFKKCPLIVNGFFNNSIARQLFYGSEEGQETNFKKGFSEFNQNFDISDAVNKVAELLEYLHFIGITINKSAIIDEVARGSNSYIKILEKTHYILKTLTNYDNSLDLNNPYHNNMGDLLFFLKLEEGDGGKNKQLTLFNELELPDFYNKFIELPQGYEKDIVAKKLFDRIENSNTSYFLTGKAGTGKSTFIHYFTKTTNKKVLLIAFTGIAAINIGGQTIHSFFRFPLKPLLPNDPDITIFQPFSQKRTIIEQTDTIVIDEVSMLRADLLEGLDYSLRKNGGNPNIVFGGKQILFVGDIFQLPPVVNSEDEVEKELFTSIYASEYFFDSLAYKELHVECFEFSKVYRQQNENFISLLNRVRDCSIDSNGIDELNQRYKPAFAPPIEDFVIMLTTNKYLAKSENANKLNKLPYKSHFFKATITGDFNEDKYPTEPILELRRNSQIMLVKNDSQDNGRKWVNGTIAKIEFLDENNIEIKLKDNSTYTLQRVTWENRKYKWDNDKKRITSKVVGTFEQFPIKLAWAITIHKSQGLTFDNVILDLGSGAFINGQLYTALSRCRTLEGLTLKRKIQAKDIIEDKRLIDFYDNSINQKSIVLNVNDINDFIHKNHSFLLRLICVHHQFSIEEILRYSAILKWGSGVNSWHESDLYYQSHSMAVYGLCFNSNIEWVNEILKTNHFECNSYQWINYDENAFPLSIFTEFEARTEISINLYEPYYDERKLTHLNYDELNDELNIIESAQNGVFNFSTLEELIQFTNNSWSIYCLNKSLYENIKNLFKENKIEMNTDIFERLLSNTK